jgi:hypothetical protein
MRLSLRRRRPAPTPPAPGGLPTVRTERALIALAVHAQQMDLRLARVEQRLGQLDDIELRLDLPTHEDLTAVRIHSARVAAELARVTLDLQGRIEGLADQMPPIVAESKRQERARTLAETIIDLSDALDTVAVDLRTPSEDWAVTA